MVLVDTHRNSAEFIAQEIFPTRTFPQSPAPSKKETYDDPSKNYGFYIAVRMGDSKAQNSFHPSHPILQSLKNENYNLTNLPISPDKAIHIDGYHFYKIPEPKIETLHQVDRLSKEKSFLFNAVIEGMNKNIKEEHYSYQIFNPVDLSFSFKADSTNQMQFEFKDKQSENQTIEKSFSYNDMYGYGAESPFYAGLKNIVSDIIDQAL